MKPTEIKAALILRGIKIVDIAKGIGVTQPTVTMTMYGIRKSERVRRAIAEAIGWSYKDVWGEEDPNKNEQ